MAQETKVRESTGADANGHPAVGRRVTRPDAAVGGRPATPHHGSQADQPVVIAICRELAGRGIASRRFRFRVGMRDNEALNASAARDVALAVEAIRMWNFVNPRRVAVAGHSFGASAILRALPNLGDAPAVPLLAPPVNSLAAPPA